VAGRTWKTREGKNDFQKKLGKIVGEAAREGERKKKGIRLIRFGGQTTIPGGVP